MAHARSLQALSLPLVLAALTFAPSAFADVLPNSACGPTAKAGQTCTTAGDGTEDGICVSSTCTSGGGNPLDDASTHGTYPCLLCELVDASAPSSDAGTSDAGPEPGDAGPKPSEDAGPTPVDDDGGAQAADGGSSPNHLASTSSCTVAIPGAGGAEGAAWAFGLSAIGLVIAAVSRRRRS
jgi:hypothetical protein